MQVCSEHQHGATHSSCICTRKASWDEQGTSSRRVHTSLLRADVPGSWHRHRRECHLGIIEEQESTELWLSRRSMVLA